MIKPTERDLDLKAHRCPSAMTMARIGIRQAIESGEPSLIVYTIEPQLEKHIGAYLNAQGFGDSNIDVDSKDITEDMLDDFRNMEKEAFDDDDFEMADKYKRITVKFKAEAVQ